MGVDPDDKSLMGRLLRVQGKFEDSVTRRMEHNAQSGQSNLNNDMERMSLQPQSDSNAQRPRSNGSSFNSHGQKSPPEDPPQYSQPISQSVSHSDAKLQKSQQKSADIQPVPTSVASSSTAPPPSANFSTHFASLSLHMSDRIRLLEFPHHIIDLVRDCLMRNWRRGIQNEGDYYGSYEFKLRGNPWRSGWDYESIDARRIVRNLFEALYDAGWVLALSTDISKKQLDKDTLIFRHQIPAPARCEWICIDFVRGDRIRIMDAQQSMLDAVWAQLQPAIQEYKTQSAPGVWEIKLHGYPWRAIGGETMHSRQILLHLLMVLEHFGYTVYASVDQESTAQDKVSDTDTWHCSRPIGWTPGAPVYHA